MLTYGANFGRDADTIATMGGAIAGAYQGIQGIRVDWLEKAQGLTQVDQKHLTERLIQAAKAKFEAQKVAQQAFLQILT